MGKLFMLFSLLSFFCFLDAQKENLYQTQIELLKKEIEALKKEHNRRESRSRIEMDHLKSKIEEISKPKSKTSEAEKALLKEIDIALQEIPAEPNDNMASVSLGGKSKLRLIDISLDALFVAGASTTRENTLRELQGGAHDPQKRGFAAQNIELSLTGAIDPFFTAEAHIIFGLTTEGESFLEIEEIFAETSFLPWGFQAKVGQYFTPFGRFNPTHPHAWSFVDQPIINTRLLGGDGTRGLGTQLSWLAPTPWYFELVAGIQNANGLAPSFLGGEHAHEEEEHEEDTGPVFFENELPAIERDVRNFDDLLYSFRALNSFDLSDTLTLNLGMSYLVGPNQTGEHTWTHLVGGDFYLKWIPESNNKGYPFVSWHTEMMYRHYEVDDVEEIFTEADGSFGGINILSPKQKLQDWGGFTQIDVGIIPNWVLGLRYDFADSDTQDAGNFLRQDRHRGSFALTHFFSEYSKIRFQYNLDRSNLLLERDNHRFEHSFWLQFEFLLGSHGAHKF